VITNVYIDGFNLYYGALRNSPHRWLDLEKLCGLLLPGNRIVRIKYFTALVSARPDNPDQPARQRTYLRALGTLPKVSVHLGHFLSHVVTMPLAVPPGQPQEYVKVIKTEEKGSDVALATELLNDAHWNRFEAAVLVTNDSDLLPPIKIARHELGKVVGVINPQRHPSRVLMAHAHFVKKIRPGALAVSQFPPTLSDGRGIFAKPPAW